MEFFLGAFEQEWERRRAALLHDLEVGRNVDADWPLRRMGGSAALEDAGAGKVRRVGIRTKSSHNARLARSADRTMRLRFTALARGSQPAVVKLASYGGGRRTAAMGRYVSREGAIAVENERGQSILGKSAVAAEVAQWEHLFANRAASRDVAVFQATMDMEAIGADRFNDAQVRAILRAGLGERRFVYAVDQPSAGKAVVHGVAMLRQHDGSRLSGDAKAASIVEKWIVENEVASGVPVSFRFHGYGNGVEFGTARVRGLARRFQGGVKDERGLSILSHQQAGDLVQKEWRRDLHSRKSRDVMHLVISARRGTDATAFENAVRDFLGTQFAGYRYIFALHDPGRDPRETGQGGKRPHIHAHAIVTMRSQAGERIVTSPQVFRDWRSRMAASARDQGLDMELTDRRESASAPAYTRKQVRPVGYAGRTEHVGTSQAAQARYDAKRSNLARLANSDKTRIYATRAGQVWRDLAVADRSTVADFAARRLERLAEVSRQYKKDFENRPISADNGNYKSILMAVVELVEGEEMPMRNMSRAEFEIYEKRVEAVLADFESSVRPEDRQDLSEIAAAAREVVNIRREYLQLVEQQAGSRNSGRFDREERRDAGAGNIEAEGPMLRQERALMPGHLSDTHTSQHGAPTRSGKEGVAGTKKVQRSDSEQGHSDRSRPPTRESEHNQHDERDR